MRSGWPPCLHDRVRRGSRYYCIITGGKPELITAEDCWQCHDFQHAPPKPPPVEYSHIPITGNEREWLDSLGVGKRG